MTHGLTWREIHQSTLRPKKINHLFLGHRLIAFSYAAFVILFSELKKNMTIPPHH